MGTRLLLNKGGLDWSDLWYYTSIMYVDVYLNVNSSICTSCVIAHILIKFETGQFLRPYIQGHLHMIYSV